MKLSHFPKAVALVLLSQSAWASSVALTASVIPEGLPFGQCTDSKTGNQVASCNPGNVFPVGFGSYIGVATAQATFGSLSVLASSTAMGHDPRVQVGGGGTASAQVVTTDTLMVTTGPKTGFLRYQFDTTGLVTLTGDPNPGHSVTATLTVNGVPVPGFGKAGNVGTFTATNFFDVPFAAGTATVVVVLNATDKCATVSGLTKTCTAVADLSHFVTVSGVGVLDDTKNIVPTATIVAQSGFSYSALPPPPAPPAPTVDSISGLVPGASSQTFTVKYSSANGFASLVDAHVLINVAVNSVGACWVAYDKPSNLFYLCNDQGNGLAGSVAPSSKDTASNSQCTLTGTGSSVSGAGNTLSMTLNLTFKNGFGTSQNIFANGFDDMGLSSGWINLTPPAAPVRLILP